MFILPSGHLPHTATRMAFGADPCMGRQRTEQLLSYYFGLKTIIRLNGIRNHDITDAHIDFYARCIILLLPTDRHMTPINWQTAALHDLHPRHSIACWRCAARYLWLNRPAVISIRTVPTSRHCTFGRNRTVKLWPAAVSCRRKTVRHRQPSAGW